MWAKYRTGKGFIWHRSACNMIENMKQHIQNYGSSSSVMSETKVENVFFANEETQ